MVTPDLTKVDLPHLQRDAVKYNDAGVLSSEANVWWQHFIGNFESSYGSTPEDTPMWHLEELVRIRQKSEPPPQHITSVPDKILDMCRSQTSQQQKVDIEYSNGACSLVARLCGKPGNEATNGVQLMAYKIDS